MRQLVMLLGSIALLGCGPQPKGPVTTADAPDEPGGGTIAGGTGGPVTPENICARILALKDAGCDLVSGYSLTQAECSDDMRRSLEERGVEARQANSAMGRCLLDNDTCQAVATCVENLNPYSDAQDGTPSQFRACEDHGVYAPVGVSSAEWSARVGGSARRYADVSTTKDEPVEVCGLPQQLEWLMGVTCNDGSVPFASGQHAHAARVGNVGAGGRCGSIIDLYEVPCPEGTYQIYIDAYVCPKAD